jgi:hypothetical protein
MTRRDALVDARAHEPLTQTPWDADRARAAIGTIVRDTEDAFAGDMLWPPHPLDEEEDEPTLGRVSSFTWARRVSSGRSTRSSAAASRISPGTGARSRSACRSNTGRSPIFPSEGVAPSLLAGESGVLLVAHTLAPARWQEEQLLAAVRSNVANPTLELLWGSPGTMLAAQVMHERTGDAAWAEAWLDSAERLWAAWDGELWRQDLYGRRRYILGSGHGFAGNVYVLARGDLLDDRRRAELERRAVVVIEKHAQRSDGVVQWPPTVYRPQTAQPEVIRTQWCHGAPGVVASLASLAPRDEILTELLVAGGELTWQAGPLRKGAGLCHGTVGNGYAFLKLLERTGDEVWLSRARVFAMHAIEQVERTAGHYSRGRHTLWTGDPGTAVYLAACIDAATGFPALDVW